MEEFENLAYRIHGITNSLDSDSDSGQEFDYLYYSLKPPPLDYESIKDKIVEIPTKIPSCKKHINHRTDKNIPTEGKGQQVEVKMKSKTKPKSAGQEKYLNENDKNLCNTAITYGTNKKIDNCQVEKVKKKKTRKRKSTQQNKNPVTTCQSQTNDTNINTLKNTYNTAIVNNIVKDIETCQREKREKKMRKKERRRLRELFQFNTEEINKIQTELNKLNCPSIFLSGDSIRKQNKLLKEQEKIMYNEWVEKCRMAKAIIQSNSKQEKKNNKKPITAAVVNDACKKAGIGHMAKIKNENETKSNSTQDIKNVNMVESVSSTTTVKGTVRETGSGQIATNKKKKETKSNTTQENKNYKSPTTTCHSQTSSTKMNITKNASSTAIVKGTVKEIGNSQMGKIEKKISNTAQENKNPITTYHSQTSDTKINIVINASNTAIVCDTAKKTGNGQVAKIEKKNEIKSNSIQENKNNKTPNTTCHSQTSGINMNVVKNASSTAVVNGTVKEMGNYQGAKTKKKKKKSKCTQQNTNEKNPITTCHSQISGTKVNIVKNTSTTAIVIGRVKETGNCPMTKIKKSETKSNATEENKNNRNPTTTCHSQPSGTKMNTVKSTSSSTIVNGTVKQTGNCQVVNIKQIKTGSTSTQENKNSKNPIIIGRLQTSGTEMNIVKNASSSVAVVNWAVKEMENCQSVNIKKKESKSKSTQQNKNDNSSITCHSQTAGTKMNTVKSTSSSTIVNDTVKKTGNCQVANITQIKTASTSTQENKNSKNAIITACLQTSGTDMNIVKNASSSVAVVNSTVKETGNSQTVKIKKKKSKSKSTQQNKNDNPSITCHSQTADTKTNILNGTVKGTEDCWMEKMNLKKEIKSNSTQENKNGKNPTTTCVSHTFNTIMKVAKTVPSPAIVNDTVKETGDCQMIKIKLPQETKSNSTQENKTGKNPTTTCVSHTSNTNMKVAKTVPSPAIVNGTVKETGDCQMIKIKLPQETKSNSTQENKTGKNPTTTCLSHTSNTNMNVAKTVPSPAIVNDTVKETGNCQNATKKKRKKKNKSKTTQQNMSFIQTTDTIILKNACNTVIENVAVKETENSSNLLNSLENKKGASDLVQVRKSDIKVNQLNNNLDVSKTTVDETLKNDVHGCYYYDYTGENFEPYMEFRERYLYRSIDNISDTEGTEREQIRTEEEKIRINVNNIHNVSEDTFDESLKNDTSCHYYIYTGEHFEPYMEFRDKYLYMSLDNVSDTKGTEKEQIRTEEDKFSKSEIDISNLNNIHDVPEGTFDETLKNDTNCYYYDYTGENFQSYMEFRETYFGLSLDNILERKHSEGESGKHLGAEKEESTYDSVQVRKSNVNVNHLNNNNKVCENTSHEALIDDISCNYCNRILVGKNITVTKCGCRENELDNVSNNLQYDDLLPNNCEIILKVINVSFILFICYVTKLVICQYYFDIYLFFIYYMSVILCSFLSMM